MERLVLNQAALAHIDAYSEYLNIVGEDPSAPLLSEEEFQKRKKEAIDNAKNRVFCFWVNSQGLECRTVGPSTKCVCGCRYRVHAPLTKDKPSSCRTRGCGCRNFEVLPGHGSSYSRCGCKHSAEDHAKIGRRKCQKTTCSCTGFSTTVSCTCGENSASHRTIFQTIEERKELGKNTDNLCGGYYPTGGGVTNFASMFGESGMYGNNKHMLHNDNGVRSVEQHPPAIGSQEELDMLYNMRKQEELHARRLRNSGKAARHRRI
ncbi:hypothetical protein P9112_001265 [Eukaryota sp. TZLM1-RC]